MDENKTPEPEQENPQTEPQQETVPLQDNLPKRISTMVIICAILMGGGVLTPVLANLGFMEDMYLSLGISNIIAIGTGIIMGIIVSRTFFAPLPKYFLNMFICTFYTVGSFWACYGYSFFRKTLWKIELVIPFGIGLMPVILYLLIKAKIEKKGEEKTSESIES